MLKISVILNLLGLCFIFFPGVKGCGCSGAIQRDTCPEENVEDTVLSIEVRKLLSGLENSEEYDLPPRNELVLLNQSKSYFGTDEPIINVDHESPEIITNLHPFLIQKYEVSNLEFAHFVAETGYRTDAEIFNFSFLFHTFLENYSQPLKDEITQEVQDYPWWLPVYNSNWLYVFGNSSKEQGNVFTLNLLNHPVIHVSHNDAVAYCEWLGMRLPSEREFERAAHGQQKENMKFPWGKKLHTRDENKTLVHRANIYQGEFPIRNSAKDGFIFTAPVDAFGPQTEDGVFNLIGNVWEWVEDEWTDKRSAPTTDGKQDSTKIRELERVKKGGSFLCHKSYCYRYRIAARSHNTADTSAHNLGFRCAKSTL